MLCIALNCLAYYSYKGHSLSFRPLTDPRLTNSGPCVYLTTFWNTLDRLVHVHRTCYNDDDDDGDDKEVDDNDDNANDNEDCDSDDDSDNDDSDDSNSNDGDSDSNSNEGDSDD